MRADLHLHTVYSDGVYSPAEVARRAKENGVRLLAFTDHDSMEGGEEKLAAAKQYGLLFVRGWEVSAYAGEMKVHVLGYGCETGERYRAFSEERKRGALVRAADMIEKANKRFGLHVTLEEAESLHLKKDTPIHTMHVVKTFAQKLGVPFGELYEREFTYGKAAYSGLCRPTPQDAVAVIHACGGIAVLAHPGRISGQGNARKRLADELVSLGLDGIECYHSSHTVLETEGFLAYARAHGLLVTGGSDFHAEVTRRPGYPEFYADDKLLSALKPV